jgi:hypothetical protein
MKKSESLVSRKPCIDMLPPAALPGAKLFQMDSKGLLKEQAFVLTLTVLLIPRPRPKWVGGATPLLKKFDQNFLLPSGRLRYRHSTIDATLAPSLIIPLIGYCQMKKSASVVPSLTIPLILQRGEANESRKPTVTQ